MSKLNINITLRFKIDWKFKRQKSSKQNHTCADTIIQMYTYVYTSMYAQAIAKMMKAISDEGSW